MRNSNEKGFMLIETMLVSIFIASTLIFIYIQFQKVRTSYSNSFTYDTVNGIYANQIVLGYLQENGIKNLSNTMESTTLDYIDLTNCPSAYLENTAYCSRIISDLGIKKIYYISSDVTPFKEKMESLKLSSKFKRYVERIKPTNGIGYRLIAEFNDETFATILARAGSVETVEIYEVGDEIYYNPVTNTKCTAGEVNTAVNAKTGCLKWNVIKDGGSTADIMLDHNSTGHVAWVSKEDYVAAGGTVTEFGTTGNSGKGPITINKQLQTDVSTWNASVKGTARLITGQEVADIGKDTAWNPGNYTGTTYSTQSWLYQNLSSGNTVEKSYGYATSTSDSSHSNYVWGVIYGGYLRNYIITRMTEFGVRPVITISKSAIS